MTQTRARDLLDFAVEVAWRAGCLSLSRYQTRVVAKTMPDASPLNETRRAAEHLMRELIETRYPADGITGDELGCLRDGADRRWIIDPLGDAPCFLHGVPLFGVVLGLEIRGEATLGVLHFPALHETVYAARGEGCWWNARRALVSETTRLDDALLLTADAARLEASGLVAGWNRLRARAGLCRTWGDVYGYALVATGRAEVMFEATRTGRSAVALASIIEEAGGVISSEAPTDATAGRAMLATNAALAREVRELLANDA